MSKEIDRYLKAMIEDVPKTIKDFQNSKQQKMIYYTGNWAKDVEANLTERQAEKLNKKMEKFRGIPGLAFFQKRMKPIQIGETEYSGAETIYGYQYMVMKYKMEANA